MPVRAWGDLTTEEIRAFGGAVAVLPVAAIEQHGPHLPLGTDAIIAEGYLDRLTGPTFRPALDAVAALVLPVQAVGKSDEHDSFTGTLTLKPETALRAWTEIGAGVHRAGVERLVIVSSHGGNSALIDLVAGELRNLGMIAVTTSWSRLGLPEGVLPEAEIRHGIHGGGIETALMLALRPDLVRTREIGDFAPRTLAMEGDYSVLRAGRPAAFAWKAEDLHASGAIGNAGLGTAEIGHALLDHGARRFAALLCEVARFRL